MRGGLVGFLLGMAKLAIRGSLHQADCLFLYQGYVRAQVSLENEHVVSTGTRSTGHHWGVDCILDQDCNIVI